MPSAVLYSLTRVLVEKSAVPVAMCAGSGLLRDASEAPRRLPYVGHSGFGVVSN